MKGLEQKIRQLVPSLQELSFGCEFSFEEEDESLPVKTTHKDIVVSVTTHNSVYVIGRKNEYDFEDIREVTILGHPIQLHHVLQAIALTIGDEYAWEQAIDTTGQFRTDWGDKRHEGSGIYWDLTLPLSGQSEEVVKFLNEVLN